jgi:hypothetical protein
VKRAKQRPLPSVYRCNEFGLVADKRYAKLIATGKTVSWYEMRELLLDGARSRISRFGDANYFTSIRAGIKKRLLEDMELNAIADARSGQLIIKVKLEDL